MNKIRFANDKEMEVTGVTQTGDTLRIEAKSSGVDALVTLFKDNPAATSRILYYVEEDLLRGYAGYTDLIGINFVPNVVKDIDYTVPDDTTESGFRETVVDTVQITMGKVSARSIPEQLVADVAEIKQDLAKVNEIYGG